MRPPRGPDPDDPDEFMQQFRREVQNARIAVGNYNEGQEHVAKNIILWAAGIASALLVAGILGGLSLSNQLAVTTEKVNSLEIQARQRSEEHRQDLQELKDDVRGLRQDVQGLKNDHRP